MPTQGKVEQRANRWPSTANRDSPPPKRRRTRGSFAGAKLPPMTSVRLARAPPRSTPPREARPAAGHARQTGGHRAAAIAAHSSPGSRPPLGAVERAVRGRCWIGFIPHAAARGDNVSELVTGEAVVLDIRLARPATRAIAIAIDFAIEFTALYLLTIPLGYVAAD